MLKRTLGIREAAAGDHREAVRSAMGGEGDCINRVERRPKCQRKMAIINILLST